ATEYGDSAKFPDSVASSPYSPPANACNAATVRSAAFGSTSARSVSGRAVSALLVEPVIAHPEADAARAANVVRSKSRRRIMSRQRNRMVSSSVQGRAVDDTGQREWNPEVGRR